MTDQTDPSPEELARLLEVLGIHQAALARLVRVDRGAPTRWLSGAVPVPLWLIVHLRALAALRALCGQVLRVGAADNLPPRLRDAPVFLSVNVDSSHDIAFKEHTVTPESAEYGEDATEMTPEDFKAALLALDWSQAAFARNVGCTTPTANRWAQGVNPIPAWVGAHLGLLIEIKKLHASFVQPRKTAGGAP